MMMTDSSATIIKPPAALNRLPPASEVRFPGLFAWSPVSTTAVTAALNLDRGLWATWRNRGLTPAPLPSSWFKRTTGSPLIYRVDHILAWLAARHGEQLDTLSAWRHSLLTDLETAASDPDQVRGFAHLYARAAGPVVGDVRFTPSGFQNYLTSLQN